MGGSYRKSPLPSLWEVWLRWEGEHELRGCGVQEILEHAGSTEGKE